MTGHRLGAWQGTALLVGAVLGPGMLVLPHLAAVSAGPASVLAWAGLLALSVPVAATFAALGTLRPGGGGVAAFVRPVFGPRAEAVVGWWFYGAVPLGTLAGALVGGRYVAASLGGGSGLANAVAGALLAGAFAANAAGLRVSGRLQLVMVLTLVGLLAVAVVVAAPSVSTTHFTPFAPYGMAGVADAAGVLLFAVVGWEAASHLSGEFADRRRGLVRATRITLAVVAVLYLGVAVVATGTGATGSPVPLTALLETGVGPVARPVTGVLALLLTFGAVNTYIAGAARLGAALAAEGALPRRFADPAGGVRRSLALLGALTGGVAAVALVSGLDVDPLMRATSACLAAVTTAGTAAAIPTLTGSRRAVAVTATVFSGVATAFCGWYLLVPLTLALAALAVLGLRVRVATT
ncbi:amino acid permease [Streptosporangium saharense]|uniref:Amino acid efflux transporter n=1 Tax=Streptosporangium saharense TaxID=1706840 RepID=A0A7W7VKA6_9ACTN|nr:amino acid permease [Streptosporangium saharense]MBB4913486.1 amino acid efflux transporter [Streptosporangium saharense]